ncbi:MAG: glycosyltransferase, exosortase A system-associated [Sphingomonas sp.]|uniref:TIGR04063 family PEP-CTERM/XrtA system glycosyltransferase n=1 Tax=Sphingomonas sp. TaxID=28214 RepID=UPI001ACE7E80|nr:TIGR04063 family PEP-CTERM/XrtA system glycosyltransferase [Sphingomonas sp.]MBN8808523.1 glycosyltransferase, exosortase A system-associated [Sphingomonas sp.]
MRILHVLDHGLPLQSGYTFRTRAILKAQIANGWQVAAVTGARQGASGATSEVVDGLTFHRTPLPAPARSPIHEWREIAVLTDRVTEVAREFRPDVIHAHSPVLDGIAALRAGKRLRLPVLYEIRAFWEDAAVGNGTGVEGSLKYRTIKWLETRAVRRADAVAVICDGLRRDLVARGIDPAKIMVSPNGVDLDLFGVPVARDAKLAAKLGLTTSDDVVGFIGSFYDYEGLDDLIAAMPLLLTARPKAKLLLVGGGPMADALRAQAAASPAAAAIRFVGRVPHDEVERYYSLVDVLAYPRRKMRLTDLVTPLKPLEGMAQRRLVAASDVGGHRELIRDGETGTLFAPGDPAAAARALAMLFADRASWNARRDDARRWVEQDRNWSSNISRYAPVYQTLVEQRKSGLTWTPSWVASA